MNLTIYLEDYLVEQLNTQAENLDESRNALIQLAIREWLDRSQSNGWSHAVRSFKGISDFTPFEDYRSELPPPKIEDDIST